MAKSRELVLGSASVSRNWQTYLIREARPYLGLKRGDDVEFVVDVPSMRVFIRKKGSGNNRPK